VSDVEASDSGTLVTILALLAIVVGLTGIVIPVLPGLLLCWAGAVGWALFGGAGNVRWVVLVIATVLAVAGTVIKFAVPGRNLKNAGIPNRSILAGGVLGVIGFFVVPVVGLIAGFVLGIWLAELARLKDPGTAWGSTKHALKATGLSILIELAAGLGIAVTVIAGIVIG
jgi:uncharacterized protein